MSFPEKLHRLRHRLPTRERIFASRWARPFAPFFDKPYFWSLNRRKVALAVAIGLFCGLMPGPTQMMSALLVAYLLRAQLPVAVFTTLYTNPFTYLPLYYLAYELGRNVLGLPPPDLNMPEWHAWQEQSALWWSTYGKPLLLGVPLLGSLFALTGYVTVRTVWRCLTVRRWRQRHSSSAQ
ncbi:MAG: DUF2062 domain-containing protein [Neisseria sp.]|nr:DUF2062 domain-containing protein [Neisseria sp.]